MFFTGDLGFMALEPLQSALGKDFINAGIAEQNMVGVAAGVASQGTATWVYSIAPFLYARPFESIRNDICYHNADVKLVGNGGGYGYGYMGSTHHAIEDYGVLSGLRNMTCYLPAFGSDVDCIVKTLCRHPGPAYIRLGRDEAPAEFERPVFAPWRRLFAGLQGVLVVAGAIASSLVDALSKQHWMLRPEVWIAGTMPLAPLPEELLNAVGGSGLVVAEEHVAQGGVGPALLAALAAEGCFPSSFRHCHARSGAPVASGSQKYLRLMDGLDPETIIRPVASSPSKALFRKNELVPETKIGFAR